MPGEAQFGREIKELFEQRRAELLEKLNRLETRQKQGWGYRKTLRKGHLVRAHRVRPHYAWLPVKRK